MTKAEFLTQLQQRLGGLQQADVNERLSFYSEMIDDRMEEGLTEEEAVRQIGSMEEAAQQVLAEAAPSQQDRETVPLKKGPGAGVIVLLILGFPLWFPLTVAAAAVLFSLLIALWAVELSFTAGAIGSVIASGFNLMYGTWQMALYTLGTGVLLAGLAIFLFFGCKAATKGVWRLVKKCVAGIGSLFGRRGGDNEKNS